VEYLMGPELSVTVEVFVGKVMEDLRVGPGESEQMKGFGKPGWQRSSTVRNSEWRAWMVEVWGMLIIYVYMTVGICSFFPVFSIDVVASFFEVREGTKECMLTSESKKTGCQWNDHDSERVTYEHDLVGHSIHCLEQMLDG
jgi:hypothetical protein